MRIISKEEFDIEKDSLIEKILKGAIFIYPTDTIYGIGCNAQNSKAVSKIRELKDRVKNPFSVIAPSKQWILENMYVSNEAREWINKLPGHYTLILKAKAKCVASEVNPRLDTIGIRIPKHWISKVVTEAGFPIVTTSVNKSGQSFMTSFENLDDFIKMKVDFIIYEGPKEAKPSKIIDLTGKTKILER